MGPLSQKETLPVSFLPHFSLESALTAINLLPQEQILSFKKRSLLERFCQPEKHLEGTKYVSVCNSSRKAVVPPYT